MRTFVFSAELSASGETFIRDFLYKLFSSVQQARYVAPVPPRAPYRALGMPFAPPRPYKGCYGRYCVPYPREMARMASATTRTLHNKYIIIIIKLARAGPRARVARARGRRVVGSSTDINIILLYII